MSEKNTRLFFCISVMLMLSLVPISQVFPFDLVLPQTASAQPSISLIRNQTNSSTLTLAPFQIQIPNFNGSGSSGGDSGRLLVVAVEANNESVTSVTFGGKQLTKTAESFRNEYTAFWYLTNPTGVSNIVITMGGSTGVVAGAYLFSGVDIGNPIPTTATSFKSGNPTVSITTEYSNSWVLDSPSIFGGSTLSSPTCTQYWDKQILNQVTGASSAKITTSAGTVTCSWTSSTGGNGWDDSAIEIKAAGTAPPVTPIILNGESTAAGTVKTSPFQTTIYNFSAGSGSNRLLVVAVASNNQSVSSIAFDGTALTKKVSSFSNNDAEFWYLKNPVGRGNIDVTMNGATTFVIGAYSFSGVNQTTPIPTTNTNHNSVAGSPTISLTTTSPNDWVLDLPSIYGGVTLSSPTCTQQWNVNMPTSTHSKITGASSSTLVPTTGSVTCKWTASAGDFWDDAAIEIKAISLTASTGILEPLYNGPYSIPNCHQNSCFNWRDVNATKLQHPNVPLFAIVNPNSGPCFSGSGNTCSYNRDFSNGIGNLTRDGVIVLGYTFTGNANPHWDDSIHCCPYSTPQGNVTQWATMYGPQNSTFASNGVKGIFLDQMNNSPGTHSVPIDYYQNLTQYAKSLGFTYIIGNPGTQTISSYVNSGAADNIVINETEMNSHHTPVITSDLQTDTFSTVVNDLGFDKRNFSFLMYNQTSLPATTTIGNQSNYVGLMFYSNTTSCCPFDVWGKVPPYLSTLAAILDNKTSIMTINSTGPSGPVTGLLVQVSQKGNLIPSGYTPYSYLGTQGVTYTFTPQNSTSCTFNHWKDTSTGPAARTITVGSTSKVYTVVYSGASCK